MTKDAADSEEKEPQIRRFDTTKTINDDEHSEENSSSTDSFIGSSDDEDDLDMEEKLLQREIIKNFVALVRKKDNKDIKYSGELARRSCTAARFSV